MSMRVFFWTDTCLGIDSFGIYSRGIDSQGIHRRNQELATRAVRS